MVSVHTRIALKRSQVRLPANAQNAKRPYPRCRVISGLLSQNGSILPGHSGYIFGPFRTTNDGPGPDKTTPLILYPISRLSIGQIMTPFISVSVTILFYYLAGRLNSYNSLQFVTKH